jgi:Tfp pilus assembly protein PilN
MPILKINLLPPRIRQARNKRLMILGGAVAAAVLLTIPAGFWYIRWTVAAGLRAQIKAIDAESVAYAGIIDKVTLLETQEGALAQKLDVLDKLIARQTTWIKILESLSFAQTHAKDLWLTTLTSKSLTLGADAGKIELTINGQAFSAASVDDFMHTLSRADLANLEIGLPTMTASMVANQPVLQFNFAIKFKA